MEKWEYGGKVFFYTDAPDFNWMRRIKPQPRDGLAFLIPYATNAQLCLCKKNQDDARLGSKRCGLAEYAWPHALDPAYPIEIRRIRVKILPSRRSPLPLCSLVSQQPRSKTSYPRGRRSSLRDGCGSSVW